jgi:hypothetical protein
VNKINQIKNIIEKHMQKVSHQLDNNLMRSLSFNCIREDAVKAGIFKDNNEAFFWFAQNNNQLHKIVKKLNKKYQIPNL